MAIGSSAPWTDHENRVCARDSATISSLLMPVSLVAMVPPIRGADWALPCKLAV